MHFPAGGTEVILAKKLLSVFSGFQNHCRLRFWTSWSSFLLRLPGSLGKKKTGAGWDLHCNLPFEAWKMSRNCMQTRI